ncbi:Csu type fimbrial protein [Dyella sp. 2RAB6]|uniref:Csu type fimbrial protein n=1 Tax=Dyella sp. 2RAB6 TaxID=3232992 RepID=UPI003F921F74
MMRVLALLLLGCLLLGCGTLRAQTCTAAPSNLDFGNVNPISGAAVAHSGTINVSCNWGLISLAPNALVCLNLSTTTTRAMANGANTIQYGLFQDAGNTQIWGSTVSGNTPISVTIAKPLLGTTAGATVNYYGQITAGQTTIPTTGNASTVYSQSFNAQTVLAYGYYLLVAPTCASLSSAGSFPFTVSATVTNNCNISATNLSFGTAGVIGAGINAASSLSVTCTNSDAWRISLNGGGSGNVAARVMQRTGGGGAVNYQLYTDSARTLAWGDGTGGTTRATGTGSGLAQAVSIYGRVPPQTTPQPGSYGDTVMATIEF